MKEQQIKMKSGGGRDREIMRKAKKQRQRKTNGDKWREREGIGWRALIRTK